MRNIITHISSLSIIKPILVACILILSIQTSKVGAQNPIITKTVNESVVNCLEYDVDLTVSGHAVTGSDVPVEVLLVIDRSGSMGYNIPGDPNESIDYAKDAAIELVNYVFNPANNTTGLNKIGVVSYGNSARVEIGLSLANAEEDIIDEINSLYAYGYTNIADAMETARNHFTAKGNFDCAASRNIILLSDGVPTRRLNGGY